MSGFMGDVQGAPGGKLHICKYSYFMLQHCTFH